MVELLRTNDAVLISAIEALLSGAGIAHVVVDQNISVLEGSIGAFPVAHRRRPCPRTAWQWALKAPG